MKNETREYKALVLSNYLIGLIAALFLAFLENRFQFDKIFFYNLIYWPIILLPFVGIFCKKVIETDESFYISYMFGLLKKEFKKADLLSKYSDETLFVPSPSLIVSNKHIKFKDEDKTCIIYPFGTSKFKTLRIRLEKQINESS